jgi:N-methylhydantoinase B
VEDERDPYEGRLGRPRVLRVAPAMAANPGMATGDLIELRGRHPAPLRAWVRFEAGAAEGQIALDALGRRILGVSPGDTVEVRHPPMPPIPGGLESG